MLGNIVRYNFFALEDVDKETYTLDYAVVLSANKENDTLKILPMSNKFHKESIESFCLGTVSGFVEVKNEGYVYNNQYVHFNKIMEVKKSELYPVHEQDVYGNITRDGLGNPVCVSLSEEQLDRVLSKYSVYSEGEEKSLFNLILKSDAGYMLPEDFDFEGIKSVISKKMEKYREYNFNDNKIIVFFVDGKRYSIKLGFTDNKDIKLRNEFIKNKFTNIC